MFPKKNAPMGKPKPDLSSPGPLDAMPAKPKAPTPAHEEAETPEYEQQEEYGAKLVQDIEAAGEKHGLDPEQSHAVAADFLRAIADCLSSDSDASTEGQESGEEMETEGEEAQ